MRQLSPERWKVVLRYKATLIPRSLVVVIGIAMSVSLLSCDLFKTRTPTEPSASSSNRVPPTEPELVLQNMIYAFQDGNSVNYTKSFSDASFTFEASGSAKGKYNVDWTIWNTTQEQTYFDNVKNKLQNNSKMSLTFTQTTYGTSSDICDIITHYQLDVPHTAAGVAKTFIGQAQFQLVRDSKTSEWSIQKWIDNVIGSTPSDSTWSDLKGTFAK
jgi:hypothetical protein